MTERDDLLGRSLGRDGVRFGKRLQAAQDEIVEAATADALGGVAARSEHQGRSARLLSGDAGPPTVGVPTGFTDRALLTRFDMLLQTYATSRFKPVGR